ncbi:DUF4145 domain-containing protein [Rossellomorea sp. RS05]|uniref:DUF4145 domain-containing protein n=1 Tax=Rossellomorea sp. RS05 TaxID=3149166 RepID=UPI003221AFD0
MYGKERFVCPQCGTGTSHSWYFVGAGSGEMYMSYTAHHNIIKNIDEEDYALSVCHYCDDFCLWKEGELVYPVTNLQITEPNEDLPEDIKEIYNEARNIFQFSSRSSAALLRLALESILNQQGYNSGRLVDKIDSLVDSEGTSEELVMAAEIIRLYGNSSAHVGFIDLNEDKEAAEELFMVLNLIAEHQYTKPKRLQALIDKLPAEKRENIEKKLEQVKK